MFKKLCPFVLMDNSLFAPYCILHDEPTVSFSASPVVCGRGSRVASGRGIDCNDCNDCSRSVTGRLTQPSTTTPELVEEARTVQSVVFLEADISIETNISCYKASRVPTIPLRKVNGQRKGGLCNGEKVCAFPRGSGLLRIDVSEAIGPCSPVGEGKPTQVLA
ncbi:hypothetical protein BOTBODRAFT_597451 [Botryobasidium botryosum FD-172 SS1]|uniref:Uncharacterized protein n=1 Tax=Botryobasidium botryosum (strain FD-172 SS1) TaxID=930990 RepID=A0A067M6T0_BOTB1|nr:hypothetical protein BOTBODRAFT_597451 [Botryobasidium botryosum FD-172 SS1]